MGDENKQEKQPEQKKDTSWLPIIVVFFIIVGFIGILQCSLPAFLIFEARQTSDNIVEIRNVWGAPAEIKLLLLEVNGQRQILDMYDQDAYAEIHLPKEESNRRVRILAYSGDREFVVFDQTFPFGSLPEVRVTMKPSTYNRRSEWRTILEKAWEQRG